MPVSRAGEEGVGWREVVEVEVFVVGAVGLEGVVFASMSMVVVVQRTKWSVLLLLLFVPVSCRVVERYFDICIYHLSLLLPLPLLPPLLLLLLPSFTLQQGARVKKRQDEAA